MAIPPFKKQRILGSNTGVAHCSHDRHPVVLLTKRQNSHLAAVRRSSLAREEADHTPRRSIRPAHDNHGARVRPMSARLFCINLAPPLRRDFANNSFADVWGLEPSAIITLLRTLGRILVGDCGLRNLRLSGRFGCCYPNRGACANHQPAAASMERRESACALTSVVFMTRNSFSALRKMSCIA